jgi:D-sedoheptulose 7-phosphate isomerase
MEVVVFTNGCFDIIHPGHIDLLKQARALGTKLIVGINSDSSVKSIKGDRRPFINQTDRAEILQNLRFVDEVRIFDEPTPESLIKEIKPDVLVKGGDWAKNEIVGASFVEERGGKVFSLPLKNGYSSSGIVAKIQQTVGGETCGKLVKPSKTTDLIINTLKAHLVIFQKLLSNEINNIEICAELIFTTLNKGNKILICGNGGSAADAQHLAAEFVGRYETERKALPAIALTTDSSALTALANDYGFERVFSRQVEGLAKAEDLLIAISTSGNSTNVNQAVISARQIGCKTIGLTGGGGKKLASICDACILVPEKRTARIQEAHITIAHIWCEIIDTKFKS